MTDAVVQVQHAVKRFGDLTALDDVDLTVQEGEIHGVIGPNGSGKTTLMKAIAGEHQLTSGHVFLGGRDMTSVPPEARVRQGLGMKFQVTSVAPKLSARDNLLLAFQASSSIRELLLSRTAARLEPEIRQSLADFHLSEAADSAAEILSHGQRQWLEIAMAIAQGPRVLLLDEPTAGMSPEERKSTGLLLREIRDRRSMAMVIVEHDLDFVKELSEVITVLHQGKVIAEGTSDQISTSDKVQTAYLTR